MGVVAVGDNITDCYVDIGQMFPGGNSVNVAVQVARAGGRAAYIGRVGDDARGGQIRDALAAENVDISRLSIVDGPTAFAAVSHVGDDRVFGGYERGVALFTPTAEDLHYIEQFEVVHTTYCSGMESVLPELARATRVSFDFDARTADGYADDLLPHVWIAEFSASHLTDRECEELLRWAHSFGPRHVLATRGARGAMFFDGNDLVTTAADRAQVVDTLGAGDAFIGRVLHGLDLGERPAQLLASGSDAARTACASMGGFGHGAPIPSEFIDQLDRTFTAKTPSLAIGNQR